jgi:hypothetical protein
VVSSGSQVWALEVKSGRGGKAGGMSAIRKKYPKAKTWLIGDTGVPLTEFLSCPAQE